MSGLDPKGEPILTLAAAGMAVLRTVLNHPCQSETSWSGPESEKAVKLCKWLMKDPTNDHVYVMRPDRLAWLLIAAVALAASACGHALELTLENLQLFGDGRAAYAHPAQLFELEMAGTLFVIAAVTIGRRLAARAMHARAGEDCLSPALDGVCRMGLVRCAALAGIANFVLQARALLRRAENARDLKRMLRLGLDRLPLHARGARYYALTAALQLAVGCLTQIGEGCPFCSHDVVAGLLGAIATVVALALVTRAVGRRLPALVCIIVDVVIAADRHAGLTLVSAEQRGPARWLDVWFPLLFNRPPPLLRYVSA